MTALATKDQLPSWLHPLLDAVAAVDGQVASESFPVVEPEDGVEPRESAVLVLLSEGEHGPEVLLLRRAHGLGSHAGQVAFPGGKADPTDTDLIDTALREAAEEVGVKAETVRVIATLPPMYVFVSNFRVTPVLAYWEQPHPVAVVDYGETAAVAHAPIRELADARNRLQVKGPRGFRTPGFVLPGLLVWGFTAFVVELLLSLGNWESDPGVELPELPLSQAWQFAEEREVVT
jgi:8-oxo-dGTP pyrophosphatase MutT (NUDIX family)